MSINKRQDKIEKAEEALSNLLSIIVCDATKYPSDMKEIFKIVRDKFHRMYNTDEINAINNIIDMIDTNTGLLSTDDISRIHEIDSDVSGRYGFSENVDKMNEIVRSAPIYEQFKNFFIETLVFHKRGNHEILFFSVVRAMTVIIRFDRLFGTSESKISELCIVLSDILSNPQDFC
jgi:hypothetical protein